MQMFIPYLSVLILYHLSFFKYACLEIRNSYSYWFDFLKLIFLFIKINKNLWGCASMLLVLVRWSLCSLYLRKKLLSLPHEKGNNLTLKGKDRHQRKLDETGRIFSIMGQLVLLVLFEFYSCIPWFCFGGLCCWIKEVRFKERMSGHFARWVDFAKLISDLAVFCISPIKSCLIWYLDYVTFYEMFDGPCSVPKNPFCVVTFTELILARLQISRFSKWPFPLPNFKIFSANPLGKPNLACQLENGLLFWRVCLQ